MTISISEHFVLIYPHIGRTGDNQSWCMIGECHTPLLILLSLTNGKSKKEK